MARKRDMKPSFFINAELADCGPHAMLAFAGLWCHADRDGRLKDRPRDLKPVILPHFDVDFDALLDTLDDADFIHRYEAQGERYIQITGWHEHQNPHPKEPSLDLPAPESREKKLQNAALHDSTANPDGYQGPRKEIARNVLQVPRARESVLGVSSKNVSGEGLEELLRDLERTWPRERCRDIDRPLRDSALFDTSDQIPEDLIDQARLYVEAHGFATGTVAGCPNLHRWIREKRWLEPLPATKHNPNDRIAQLQAEVAAAESEAA